ncbi:MAG: hypothetical protein HYZ68_05905, partial [Chloroflexi bacterium]|nr:hypothetical protein [Chloroflexota bacterium]
YSQAFLEGYTPATLIMDVRTSFNDYPNPPYSPENYDRVFHGPLLLRQALARSVNLPAVKLLDLIGLQDVLALAHRLGINTLNDDRYGLSLTLGGGEVTPLDMAYAYSVFVNNGVMVGRPVDPQNLRPGYRELDPVSILRVEDAQGNVLEEYRVPEARQVLDPKVAYLITHILSDNDARAPAFGLNSPLRLSRPAAAKTGTSDDWRDSWTIGYVPQLSTAVWVGNADNTPTDRVPGSLGAAFIWHDFMEAALKDMPVEVFIEPPGLERLVVDATSGLLPTQYSPPSVITELFLPGTAPTTPDDVHKAFYIFRPTGLLATASCPLELVEERVFEIYPPEADDWVRENNILQPPTEYEPCGPSPIHSDVAIISPRPYSYVRGIFNIEGNARGGDFQRYRVLFGEGLNPSAWTQIGGDHSNQVSQGWLESWDASALNGLYTLQLEVIDHNGSLRTATLQITVDNTPPEVEIVYPPEGSEFVVEDYEWVILEAAATDSLSMDRVEFYVDDQLIATDTVSPYNQKWIIPRNIGPGQHRIYVKAFDAAGNETQSGEVTFMLTKPTPTPSGGG